MKYQLRVKDIYVVEQLGINISYLEYDIDAGYLVNHRLKQITKEKRGFHKLIKNEFEYCFKEISVERSANTKILSKFSFKTFSNVVGSKQVGTIARSHCFDASCITFCHFSCFFSRTDLLSAQLSVIIG